MGGVPDLQGLHAVPSDSFTSTVISLALIPVTSHTCPASWMGSPTSGMSWMDPMVFPLQTTSISFFTVNTEQKSLWKTAFSPLGPINSVPSDILSRWPMDSMCLSKVL